MSYQPVPNPFTAFPSPGIPDTSDDDVLSPCSDDEREEQVPIREQSPPIRFMDKQKYLHGYQVQLMEEGKVVGLLQTRRLRECDIYKTLAQASRDLDTLRSERDMRIAHITELETRLQQLYQQEQRTQETANLYKMLHATSLEKIEIHARAAMRLIAKKNMKIQQLKKMIKKETVNDAGKK